MTGTPEAVRQAVAERVAALGLDLVVGEAFYRGVCFGVTLHQGGEIAYLAVEHQEPGLFTDAEMAVKIDLRLRSVLLDLEAARKAKEPQDA